MEGIELKHIFFLIIGLIASPFLVSAYATHYESIGQDDVFWWREWDVDNTYGVYCTFNGVMVSPFDDTQVSFECKHDTFNGTDVAGGLLIMKVFDKADIQNGALTNVFTWSFDNTCTEASCGYYAMAVMDGAYNATSLIKPTGFPNNAGYFTHTGSPACTQLNTIWRGNGAAGLCIGTGIADTSNIMGAGSLTITGNSAPAFSTAVAAATKGTITISGSVTQALWTESTESQITVFLILNAYEPIVSTNHFIQPRYFSITNTDFGDLTWNFPETIGEASDWYDFGGGYTGLNFDGYLLNGTTADYGYIFSYDPSVSDPPTNLYLSGDQTDGDSDLFWTAPSFTGYTSIIGYKIERESPVGGGFSVLVANTGSTSTSYQDTTITPGNTYNYRVRALNTFGESSPSNESVDGQAPSSSPNPTPNVTCPTSSSFGLNVVAVSGTTATLCWNNIDLLGANLTGYQVNYTTPWGDPVNIVNGLNDTGSSARTRLISNLVPATQYSFKVGTWTDAHRNFTNIANTTTLGNSLDFGNFTFDGKINPYKLTEFAFQTDVVNATQKNLIISYPNTYNATCTFDYKFALVQQTYTNLSTTPLTGDRVYANFTLIDSDNDVITIRCTNDDGSDNGVHLITQGLESLPIIQQVNDFRNGTYGTMGFFGIFDIITLCVVIVSMIGFNRVNSAVGAVFSGIVIGFAAFLGLVQWYTALTGFIIVITGIAIFVHNRSDTAD